MVLRMLVGVAGVEAAGVAPVTTTPVGAAAAAAVESGFRRLRLRRGAVAAAVMVAAAMVMVAAAMVMAAAAVMVIVASVMAAAVMMAGNLWIKSRLP
jgi:hypothetical protein